MKIRSALLAAAAVLTSAGILLPSTDAHAAATAGWYQVTFPGYYCDYLNLYWDGVAFVQGDHSYANCGSSVDVPADGFKTTTSKTIEPDTGAQWTVADSGVAAYNGDTGAVGVWNFDITGSTKAALAKTKWALYVNANQGGGFQETNGTNLGEPVAVEFCGGSECSTPAALAHLPGGAVQATGAP